MTTVTRVRLGVEDERGERELDMRVFFAAFDVKFDEHAEEVFQRTMRLLAARDVQSTGSR
jgi:hypothetical protein